MPDPRSVEWLLERLCTEYGFCLPVAARAQLVARPPSDGAELAAAIFRAEGLSPADHPRLAQAVREEVGRLYARDLAPDS